jgi:integrase
MRRIRSAGAAPPSTITPSGVLAEIPAEYETLFVLLALTGLRISEAIALRWSDLVLDDGRPRVRVRRALVGGVLAAPKSRHGVRTIALAEDLVTRLRAARPRHPQPGDLVFPNDHGGPQCPNNLRNRVLAPHGNAPAFPT